MTIEQIIALINKEKEQSSRFPVRVILVETLSQYKQLVEGLKKVCDNVFRISEYCDAEDIFPSIDRIKNKILTSPFSCHLIMSMAEYLRLGYQRELPGTSPQFAGLFNWQQDSTSYRKVLIPLYACEQIFEQVIGKLDERHKEHVWRVHSEDCTEQFVLSIFSKEFTDIVQSGQVAFGIRDWLNRWDDGIIGTRYSLITKQHKYAQISQGIYSTNKITGIFEYAINSLEDGNRLKQEWGSNDNWVFFAKTINNAHTISEVINKGHNMLEFDAFSVLAKWNYIDDNQRWLFWLWYQLYTNNDYISHAVSLATHYSEIPQKIKIAIISMHKDEEDQWLDERKKAIDQLKFHDNNEEFLNLIDQIPDKKRRLRLLSCEWHEERVYTVKIISQLLNERVAINDIFNIIKDKYSLLANYIQPKWGYEWDQLDEYFRLYKEYKLRNIYSGEINVSLDKSAMIFESIDTRYSLIKKFASESDKTFILWIDGLGAEWSSLLLSQILLLDPGIKYNIGTGKAMLPTETKYNNQWDDLGYPHKKLERLDKLGHNGEPDDHDYYSCIVKQLEVINEFANKAIGWLKDYDTVIITADHGTSRLAALAFHDLIGVKPPLNATLGSFGRYCEISGDIKQSDTHPSTKKIKNYFVFRTHEHYQSSGNAAGVNNTEIASPGEVHGGMTPEEMLVPVIALYKKQKIVVKKVNYSIDCTPVQPNANNEIELTLRFDSRVSIVEVTSKDKDAICTSNDGVEWRVTFKSLSFGDHTLDVYADNKLLDKHECFTVITRGIIVNDDI
jgi:hypothetical protein